MGKDNPTLYQRCDELGRLTEDDPKMQVQGYGAGCADCARKRLDGEGLNFCGDSCSIDVTLPVPRLSS